MVTVFGDFMIPAVSRSIRLAAPLLAVLWGAGCAIPLRGGVDTLDSVAVAATVRADSLRAQSAKVGDSLQVATHVVGSRKDAPSLAKVGKPVDSVKAASMPVQADTGASRRKPVQLDPSERSRDPNAWSDLFMNGDTTANRELVAVSRILHGWYTSPVEPMAVAWPDLWGHVGEITLSRPVDTFGFAAGAPAVLDLRPLVGLRKFRAARIGLDKKRLVSILVPPSLEEIDLSGNRLEILEIVAEGPSELRRVDVSGNRLASIRLSGTAPKVQATGNRLCSRLLGLPAGEKPDRIACKEFPTLADSVAKSLLERWALSGLPGETAPAKQALVPDLLPASLGTTRWIFPQSVSRCGAGEGEARFWSFGMVGYDGSDALLVGAFPALAKGKIRPGMTRSQMQAVLGKPLRSQGDVDAWVTERTTDDRLWLGLRCFYDAAGRLEGVWIRKLPRVCPDPA
ncbi:MAG TPA: hypothetical protein PKY05_14685 [Fibrobacteria bacterium]|nr:hypothetical protein [Fibrobacteria bacterium]